MAERRNSRKRDSEEHPGRRTVRERRILRLACWGYLVAGLALTVMFAPNVFTRHDAPPGMAFEIRLTFGLGVFLLAVGAYYVWTERGR